MLNSLADEAAVIPLDLVVQLGVGALLGRLRRLRTVSWASSKHPSSPMTKSSRKKSKKTQKKTQLSRVVAGLCLFVDAPACG